MRVSRLSAVHNVNPMFLHVPGTQLIKEGVDAMSRDGTTDRLGAASLRGPACSHSLKQRIFGMAARLGWSISVDLFASGCNRLVPRYFSQYFEPDAEAADALSVPDWGFSHCPRCNKPHQESVFAFPPGHWTLPCVRKARADGVRGILVVPVSVTAPYWGILLRASVIRSDPGYVEVQNAKKQLLFADDYRVQVLAVFAVDFGSTSSGLRANSSAAPACGQVSCWRGRGGPFVAADVDDWRRIHAALQSLPPPA